MAFFENDLKTLFPELFCIASSVALVLLGAAYGGEVETRAQQGEERSTATKREVLPGPAQLPAPVIGLLCLFYTFVLLLNHPIGDASGCASGFVYDSIGTQCKLILVCAALASLTVSQGVMAGVGGIECVCFMLLSICGGMLLISSGDLMSLFLSLEIQSLCFYVLAATGRTSEFSTEAGLKYLVLGAFASGVLLFGCSLLYGFSGTTSLYEVSNLAACPPGSEAFFQGRHPAQELGTSVGLLFILFGVLFKLGAAPFHSWVPDVYDGAPIFITTFFAAVPKVAILTFVLRLFAAFGGGYLFTSMLRPLPAEALYGPAPLRSPVSGCLGPLFATGLTLRIFTVAALRRAAFGCNEA